MRRPVTANDRFRYRFDNFMSRGPIALVGTRSFLPTTQDDKRWQISDGLSMTRGRHTLKVGADLNFLSASQFFAFNQFGAFGFGTSDINVILRTLSATVCPIGT